MQFNRRFASTALVVALVCAAVVGPSPTSASTGTATYIVDLADGVSTSKSARIARSYGGRAGQVFDAVVGGFAFKGSSADAARLARDPRVESVEKDLVYHAVGAPQSGVRHLKKVDVPQAYAAGYTAAGVTIALLDTGVRRSHKVFRAHNNVKRGHSCVGGGTFDGGGGHGTASASQAVGKIGVAHEAALIPVKVFPNGSLQTSLELLICGLNWVRKHNRNNPGHIDVVNISIAGPGSDALQKAVTKVQNAGIVIAAAAGNHGGAALFPARYRGVLAVTALETGKAMASFSASGGDLTALGVNILSAEDERDGAFSHRSGTSRSSPQVAGAAAVVLGEDPNANVRAVLRTSGRCPNGNVNGDAGFCPGRWAGDDARAEPLINAYCAGVLANPVDTAPGTCGF
jgi:aqualysin 1